MIEPVNQPGSEHSNAPEAIARVQQLFIKNQSIIKAFILSLQPDFQDADDVLQETFLLINKKAENYLEGTNFLAWACSIARFKLLKARRKATAPTLTEESIAALCDDAPDETYFHERLAALQVCMRRLAPRAKELVWKRYHGELPSEDIARHLGWKEPAVRVALSKARAFLRNCVEKQAAGKAAAETGKLARLFAAHLDGVLNEAQAEELSRILVESPGARRQFWGCAAVHGLMQEAARIEWLGNAAQRLENKVIRPAWWQWAAPLAAAAAIAAMLFSWNYQSQKDRTVNGVAVLSRAVGVAWADAKQSPSKDAVLTPGTLRLKTGAIEVEFYSGARVVVEGPAEFRLVSGNEAYLGSGKITAHVPSQARGFKVGSSNVTVVDYGTDFGFAVQRNTPDEVHVFNGSVEVSPHGVPPHLLKGGEAVRFENAGLRTIDVNQASFLSESELVRHDDLETQDHFKKWQKASRILTQDPDTLLYYNFENQQQEMPIMSNLASGANMGMQGSIVGCAWADGRWPGKQSLHFRGEGDRIRISIPQNMTQVTFLAWVRVDSLPVGLRSLLSADTQQDGSLRWELTPSGQLRLSIGRDLGHHEVTWEAVDSESFITPDRFSQWIMLVTTFDGKRVKHYCNGLATGSGASFTPLILTIGTADVGNTQGFRLSARHFMGTIDELAILDRVMSEDEVHRLYEAGRP